jgi:hypothetical protein
MRHSDPDKSQRRAARESSAAFRRAAKNVIAERNLSDIMNGAPEIKVVEVFPEIAYFEYIDPETEVVSRAMDLLRPVALPEWKCRDCLALIMSRTRVLRTQGRIPAPGKLKDHINDVAKALKRTKRAITTLPRVSRVVHSAYGGAFCNLLDEVLTTVQQHHNQIVQQKGCPPVDWAKYEAAYGARYAISVWKRERPTKTVNGTFYELASILYEGGTRIQGANLQRYCRRALDEPDTAQFLDLARSLSNY